MKKLLIKAAKYSGAILFWIIIWFIVSLIANDRLFLPTPIDVIVSGFAMVKTSDFWKSIFNSMTSVVSGVAVSFLIGGLLAFATSASKVLDTLFSPILSIIKATPVASFIVLAFLWFSSRNAIPALPAFISSLIVIPIVTSNLKQGLESIDGDLKEVTKIYGFSPIKTLFKLYIPSVYPFFIAACRSSLGMAWKACVAAEMIVFVSDTIGRLMYEQKTYLDFSSTFALTITTIILSVALEKVVLFALDTLGRKLRFVKGGTEDAKN